MKLRNRFEKLSPGVKRCILAIALVTAYCELFTTPPFGFIPLLLIVTAGVVAAYQLDLLLTKLWRGR